MNLERFLTETAPQPAEGETDAQALSAVEAWKHSDFICRGYVLNGLSDALYNVYYNRLPKNYGSLWIKSTKWRMREQRNLLSPFLDFKMVDNKTVMNQVQELQIKLHDIHAEGMVLSETFQVAAMIEKLPPAWLDFKNYLKYKRKEMTIEELVVRLRIEEDNRVAQKGTILQASAKANMVEVGESSKGKKGKGKKDNKGKAKVNNLGPKKGAVKKKLAPFQGTCYNCNETGHRANQCKKPKHEHAHMVDEDGMPLIAMITEEAAMIEEVNAMGENPKGWFVDTDATLHVCGNKALFSTFKEASGEEKLYMGNKATTSIKGEGTIVLKMTSGKELTLTNVLYVPEIRKNLVSGWMLNKFGFRLVFESDNFVLSRCGMFVGKGYALNGMFKMNVMVVNQNKKMNEISTSTYMIESSNVWNGRLGHVNFNSLRRLIKLNLTPTFYIDSDHKCETCVESKLTRSSFKSVERITEPLDLIHTGVCDLKAVPTHGGNKYFITFINDCTKYCYVYLLKSKDEAIEKFILYKNEVENQLNKKIKAMRSDRGGEYVAPFADLCEKVALYTSVHLLILHNQMAWRNERTAH
ncbi:putative RNA-directed DNA polymerase [Helianthus annuus]|nr:putative RNA-directed DNA polymerase [Helianthus annuus]